MDEKTKQELLEELRKEYSVTLKPLKEKQFSVADILEKYREDICLRLGVENRLKYTESIDCVIRKAMCFNYGVYTIKDIPVNQRIQFREDLEKYIKNFILKEN